MSDPSAQDFAGRAENAGAHRGSATTSSLLTQLYEELHALARQCFSEQPSDHTLQPTALLHEAYLRLANQPNDRWENRTHFFATAARAMRQVLVDHARRRAAVKRGGAWTRVSLADEDHSSSGRTMDLLALGEALDKLASLNERHCRIVEMRFLAGLTIDETAEVLSVSPRTVKLDSRMARAWLLAELRDGGPV